MEEVIAKEKHSTGVMDCAEVEKQLNDLRRGKKI